MKQKSVGIVKTKTFAIEEDLKLSSGKTLSNVELAYETYGDLNSAKSNAILVCHALTGDAHAAGKYTNDKEETGTEKRSGLFLLYQTVIA